MHKFFNLQLLDNGGQGGAGNGQGGNAGSGNGGQAGNAGNNGGNAGPSYSFQQAEEIANARASRAERAALASYFQQQGLSEEQINQAIADYKAQQAAQKPNVDAITRERDEARAERDALKNAQTLCVTLADALCAIDPDNKNTYIANAAAYRDKLAALDADYKAAVDGAAHKTVLFGDRFPFRYLVDDYGLRYYAAFAGCSAETEASFETVSFLAKKVDELGLPCVLTIEGAQHRIAETIVQNTAGKNQKVLTMDSMQSTTSKDVANGATYLSVMEKNLSVLKEALG